MDVSVYKNSWKIYFSSFGKLVSFSLSIMILFLASITTYLFLSPFDMGLTGILIFAFAVLPLFFSLQMVVGKVSAGRDVSYNELYSSYKNYYAPQNRGIYSVLLNLLLTLVILSLSVWLSLVLYDLIFPGVMDAALKAIAQPDGLSSYPEYYDSVVTAVLNMDGYLYFLTVFLAFPFLFFFCRIRKNFLLPYFNMIVGVPVFVSHSMNKKLWQTNRKEIRKVSLPADLPFIFGFLIGFILFGCVAAYFEEQLQYIEYVIVIAVAGGILCSFVFLPPLLITYCFIADTMHKKYMLMMKEQMTQAVKTMDQDDAVDEERKEALKDFLDHLTEEEDPQEKKEESSEEDSSDKNSQ